MPQHSEGETIQSPLPLYIMSNFAVGKATLTHFWHDTIARITRDSVPFHASTDHFIPIIFLEIDEKSRLAQQLQPECATFELWPTWCTFITGDFRLSETFLFLSISNKTNDWLHLRFQHEKQLALLCAIEAAQQMKLCLPSGKELCTVPLYDPELSVHIEQMKQIFASNHSAMQA